MIKKIKYREVPRLVINSILCCSIISCNIERFELIGIRVIYVVSAQI